MRNKQKTNELDKLYLVREHKYTVLEIGSGSFKLYKEGVFNTRFQSSLGKNLKNNHLDPESVAIALNSLKTQILPFLKEHDIKPEELIVFATAALRVASLAKDPNFLEFKNKFFAYGFPEIKIFSEEDECDYAAYAVMQEISETHFLILDTGGASHQLIEIKDNKIQRKQSYPIGSHSEFTRKDLPDYQSNGFTQSLPLVLLGTTAIILEGINKLNRNILRESYIAMEGMNVLQRKEFLDLMLENDNAKNLLVDFRLMILPKAFQIISHVSDTMFVSQYLFAKEQAINYIARNGFRRPS